MFFALTNRLKLYMLATWYKAGLLESAHVRSASHCYSSRQGCEHTEVTLSPG